LFTASPHTSPRADSSFVDVNAPLGAPDDGNGT
jgi:hypothetical protein